MIPRLAPILRDGIDLARARTLDVLLDLILLFVPEPGFEYVDTPAGPRALAHLVRDEIPPDPRDVIPIKSGASDRPPVRCPRAHRILRDRVAGDHAQRDRHRGGRRVKRADGGAGERGKRSVIGCSFRLGQRRRIGLLPCCCHARRDQAASSGSTWDVTIGL